MGEGTPPESDQDEQEAACRAQQGVAAQAGARNLAGQGQLGARLCKALNVRLRNLSGE